MKIIWIIDNKFRELYGLYDLKKKLFEHNIELFLFNIPVWKTAIDLINPNIVVIPNLAKTSCEPIVKYASKKKIKVFLHSSEAMFYTDEAQRQKYPTHLIKKIDKVLAWSKMDAKFLIKEGFKNKVLITGNLKFSKENYENKTKKQKKIKVIGIPTQSRVISGNGISKQNIPYYIRHVVENYEASRVGYLTFEIHYIETLVKVLKEIGEDYQVVIKVSPFEDKKIYKKTFPEVKIFQGDDIRDFLKKVDVILTVFSSTSVDALKYNIPVISITNLIKWDKSVLLDKSRGPKAKHGAVALSIQPKNVSELKQLLKKSKKKLIDMCESKNFFKKADELAITSDTLDILTKLFLEYQKKISPRDTNYFMFLKYVAVTVRQILFRRKRGKQLYYFWSLRDRKLLKSFKLY